MERTITSVELVNYLHSKSKAGIGLLDKLKVVYRPYICPFDDLLNSLPDGAKVFDIGCGSGMFLSLVSHYKKPSSLGGIEISEKLVSNANQLLSQDASHSPLFLKSFDGVHLPDEIKEYDYVFLIDVLHHVPPSQQAAFLQSIYEKMNTGAHLVLKDINGGSILKYFNKLHDFFLAGEIGNEIKYSVAKKNMVDMGFEIVETSEKRMFWYPHYTIIARKK